jgi:hypothetical protein
VRARARARARTLLFRQELCRLPVVVCVAASWRRALVQTKHPPAVTLRARSGTAGRTVSGEAGRASGAGGKCRRHRAARTTVRSSGPGARVRRGAVAQTRARGRERVCWRRVVVRPAGGSQGAGRTTRRAEIRIKLRGGGWGSVTEPSGPPDAAGTRHASEGTAPTLDSRRPDPSPSVTPAPPCRLEHDTAPATVSFSSPPPRSAHATPTGPCASPSVRRPVCTEHLRSSDACPAHDRSPAAHAGAWECRAIARARKPPAPCRDAPRHGRCATGPRSVCVPVRWRPRARQACGGGTSDCPPRDPAQCAGHQRTAHSARDARFGLRARWTALHRVLYRPV